MARIAWSYFWVMVGLALMKMKMNMMGCSAEQHVVGDDEGWDPLSDFKGWASRKIFRVGDNLWFSYASSQQSVLELKSREEFEKCNVSNPIRLFNGGLDAVPLIEVGDRFFTSGSSEACQRGMKVHVNVISDELHNVQSDNFDLVSDGLDKISKDWGLGLLSDGIEKHEDNLNVLRSDGMDHFVASSSVVDSVKNGKKPLMEAIAEGPTSGTLRLSPSILINLALSFCGTFIIILYVIV